MYTYRVSDDIMVFIRGRVEPPMTVEDAINIYETLVEEIRMELDALREDL